MKKEDNLIDNLFKDELGGYTEAPPPMAWDALEKRLDGAPPRGGAAGPRNAIYFAAVTSLLVMSVTVARKLVISPVQVNRQALARVDATTSAIHTASSASQPVTDHHTTTNNPTKSAAPGSTNTETNTGNTPNTSGSGIASHTHPTPTQVAGSIYHGAVPPKTSSQPAKTNTSAHARLTIQARHTQSRQGMVATRLMAHNTHSINRHLPMADNAEDEQTAGEKTQDIYPNTAPTAPNNKENETEEDNQPIHPGDDEPITKLIEDPNGKGREEPGNQIKKPALPRPKPKPHFSTIELGIKAGYEGSFSAGSGQKAVLAPYIQYNLSKKFAVMTQPAVKQGAIAAHAIGAKQSYYRKGNDSVSVSLDPGLIFFFNEGVVDTMNIYRYHYSQRRDSIVKAHTYGGTYTEFELPILLRYNVVKCLAVYGGVNVVYSRQINIKEQTTTITMSNDTSDIVLNRYGAGFPQNPPYTATHFFPYTGNNIADYKNPYQPVASGQFRAGYMLGFSYQYKERWLVDGLVLQTPTAPNRQGGYNINSALSAPYIRFTLGYKILK